MEDYNGFQEFVRSSKFNLNSLQIFLGNISGEFLNECLSFLIGYGSFHAKAYKICRDKSLVLYWKNFLPLAQLSPQSYILPYRLLVARHLMNVTLNHFNEVQQDASDSKFLSFLDKAIKFDSFDAMQWRNEYDLCRLKRAIEEKKNTDVGVIYQRSFKPLFHNTLGYLLQSNTCFWLAQYYGQVKQDEVITKKCYLLTIRYLTCAYYCKDYSYAAIDNFIKFYRQTHEKSDDPYDFVNLLSMLMDDKYTNILSCFKKFAGTLLSAADIRAESDRGEKLVASHTYVAMGMLDVVSCSCSFSV